MTNCLFSLDISSSCTFLLAGVKNQSYPRIRMKKRVALIAASIFTVLAVLAALIFREPSDIKLVKGVKPSSTTFLNLAPEVLVQRTYSMQMSYDEAVRKINNELPLPWFRNKTYNEATFFNSRNESIIIIRARFATNLVSPVSYWSSLRINDLDFSLTLPAYQVSNVPSAEGWITVISSRYLNRTDLMTTRIRHALTNYHEPKTQPYQLVSQRPKVEQKSASLALDSDTTSLAGTDQEVTFCP